MFSSRFLMCQSDLGLFSLRNFQTTLFSATSLPKLYIPWPISFLLCSCLTALVGAYIVVTDSLIPRMFTRSSAWSAATSPCALTRAVETFVSLHCSRLLKIVTAVSIYTVCVVVRGPGWFYHVAPRDQIHRLSHLARGELQSC